VRNGVQYKKGRLLVSGGYLARVIFHPLKLLSLEATGTVKAKHSKVRTFNGNLEAVLRTTQ
jgi:hypothetical protein